MFLVIGLTLGIVQISEAGRYRQNAYVTNAYFCENPIEEGSFIQPDRVINIVQSDNPKAAVHFVVNLILDKGQHQVEADLLDSNGKSVHAFVFDPVTAPVDDSTYSAVARFGGKAPIGSLFVKVFDRHNGGARELVGTFRLLVRASGAVN